MKYALHLLLLMLAIDQAAPTPPKTPVPAKPVIPADPPRVFPHYRWRVKGDVWYLWHRLRYVGMWDNATKTWHRWQGIGRGYVVDKNLPWGKTR